MVIFGVMLTFLVVGADRRHLGRDPSRAPRPRACRSPSAPNMEGKEVRLGPVAAATWAAMTTATSNGSVNSMHDSLNPIAGPGADVDDDAQRRLQRHRRGLREHADVRHRRRVPRRADGRPDARVPGQEGRGQGGEAGDDRDADPPAADPAPGRGCSRRPSGGPRRWPTPARTGSARSSTSSPRRRPTTARGSRAWATTTRPGTSPRGSSCCWAGSRRWCCRWPSPASWRRRSACPQTTGTLRTDNLTFAGMLLGHRAPGRRPVVHAGGGARPDRRSSVRRSSLRSRGSVRRSFAGQATVFFRTSGEASPAGDSSLPVRPAGRSSANRHSETRPACQSREFAFRILPYER